jgi:hypothetical protein
MTEWKEFHVNVQQPSARSDGEEWKTHEAEAAEAD